MNKPHSHKTKKSLVEPSPGALAERWKPYWPRMSLHLAEAADILFSQNPLVSSGGIYSDTKRLCIDVKMHSLIYVDIFLLIVWARINYIASLEPVLSFF